jgi:hypothetical protein
VSATLTAGESVPMLISGQIGAADCFAATTNIRVRKPHFGPHEQQLLAAGSLLDLTWNQGDVADNEELSLLSSRDNGETWTVEVESVPNTGLYKWRVPDVAGSMRLGLASVWEIDEAGVVTDAEVAESGTFEINTTLGVGDGSLAFAFRGITPNPNRGAFTVAFTLPDAEAASVEVFDVSGRQVLRRDIGTMGAGQHQVTLGRGLTMRPGVYLVRLNRGSQSLSGRAIIIP